MTRRRRRNRFYPFETRDCPSPVIEIPDAATLLSQRCGISKRDATWYIRRFLDRNQFEFLVENDLAEIADEISRG